LSREADRKAHSSQGGATSRPGLTPSRGNEPMAGSRDKRELPLTLRHHLPQLPAVTAGIGREEEVPADIRELPRSRGGRPRSDIADEEAF
jgi:hypothetical protein